MSFVFESGLTFHQKRLSFLRNGPQQQKMDTDQRVMTTALLFTSKSGDKKEFMIRWITKDQTLREKLAQWYNTQIIHQLKCYLAKAMMVY